MHRGRRRSYNRDMVRATRVRSVVTWVLVAGLAGLAVDRAEAGVDTWTTTGPRSVATLEVHDATRPGRIFLVLDELTLVSSDDRGRTWTTILQLDRFADEVVAISDVAADPRAPSTIRAATRGGKVYRSDDDGATWSPEVIYPSGDWIRLLIPPWGASWYGIYGESLVRFDPGAPNLQYLVVATDAVLRSDRPGEIITVSTGGVRRSTDGGATFTFIAGVPPNVNPQAAKLVFSPADPARLYWFALRADYDGNPGRMYRSDDGGVTWIAGALLDAYPFYSTPAADALHRDRLYLGGGQLLRSDDAGVTFAPVEAPGGHVAYGVDANDGRVCLTNDIGFLCSTDAGAHWHAVENDMPGRGAKAFRSNYAFEDLLVAPGTTGYVVSRWTQVARAFGTNQWYGAFALAWGGHDGDLLSQDTVPISHSPIMTRSTDGGRTWSTVAGLPPLAHECNGLVVSPADPKRMIRYGSSAPPAPFDSGCLGVSPDATTTPFVESGFNADGQGANTVVFDPSDPNVAWLGRKDVFRSVNGGLGWSPAGAFAGTAPVRSIAIDPADGRRVFVARVGAFGLDRLKLTDDGGASWTDVTAAGLIDTRAADVDWTASPARIYVATGNGVWASSWGASVWAQMTGTEGWEVHDVKVVVPRHTTQRVSLVAATSTGIYDLTLSGGLPFVPVFRFYNRDTAAHFYTASVAERDHVRATWPQFIYEGERFRVLSAPAQGTTPVYRFFNTQTGVHFYTADEAEKDHVLATWPHFAYEGVAYHAFGPDPGTAPTYRYFNMLNGVHFYTTSDEEKLTVDSSLTQYVFEGVRWHVYPSPRDPEAP